MPFSMQRRTIGQSFGYLCIREPPQRIRILYLVYLLASRICVTYGRVRVFAPSVQLQRPAIQRALRESTECFGLYAVLCQNSAEFPYVLSGTVFTCSDGNSQVRCFSNARGHSLTHMHTEFWYIPRHAGISTIYHPPCSRLDQ